MRKVCVLVLAWVFMLGTASYGAVSDDVYVRKDVFDAKMEAFMAEIRLMNEQVRSDIRELNSKIDGVERSLNSRIDGVETSLNARIDRVETRIDRVETRIDSVEKRMSSLETMIYWILATLSVSFAVLALAPYFRDFRKPSFTLDDVKRLIEENNTRLAEKYQA